MCLCLMADLFIYFLFIKFSSFSRSSDTTDREEGCAVFKLLVPKFESYKHTH